jgi:GDP-4-dehydro-6-deoxy-D-mannose reductase
LAETLVTSGWDVTGFDVRPSDEKSITHIRGDLGDSKDLTRAIQERRPDAVFHLAGVIKAEKNDLFYQAHVLGTVALFEAILQADLLPLVVIASSSAVYGLGQGKSTIKESDPLQPVTHYGISKLTQELVAIRYYETQHIPVMIVRMFNLLGPGQSPDLACSAFARQIALAEAQHTDQLHTGDLSAQRDFIDVRDAVRDYDLISSKGKPGETYNICSGKAISIQACLDMLLSMSTVPLRVILDPKRVQNNDVSIQKGSAIRLRKLTGWEPLISIEQSLRDLLDYWRANIKSEEGASQ